MSWIFDVLAVWVALCAIPIYLCLTNCLHFEKYDYQRARRDGALYALSYFVLAMTLDFLDSLPGLGVGTKSVFGQDVLEPLSHLAIVAALVVGLWHIKQIGTKTVVFMAVLGVVGFVGSTFVGDHTTVRHLANGLMPAYNWLVTGICVVSVVRLAAPKGQNQFRVLLSFGLLALAAAAAQHDLIAQWASGNAHYPILK